MNNKVIYNLYWSQHFTLNVIIKRGELHILRVEILEDIYIIYFVILL